MRAAQLGPEVGARSEASADRLRQQRSWQIVPRSACAASRRRAESDSPGKTPRLPPPPSRRTSEEAQAPTVFATCVQRSLDPRSARAARQAPTVSANSVRGRLYRGRCAQRAVGERSQTTREKRSVSHRLHPGVRWRKRKCRRAESHRPGKTPRLPPPPSRRTSEEAQAPTVFATCVQRSLDPRSARAARQAQRRRAESHSPGKTPRLPPPPSRRTPEEAQAPTVFATCVQRSLDPRSARAARQAPTVSANSVRGRSYRGRCAQRAVGERSQTTREKRSVSHRLHPGVRWRKRKCRRAESDSPGKTPRLPPPPGRRTLDEAQRSPSGVRQPG